MKRTTMIAAAALTAGMTAATGAFAAQATTTVNVRSGPSTAYGVVDVLYRGEVVDVRECRSSGWCFVTHSGPDGWVSGRYLTGGGVRVSPNVTFSFSIGRPPQGGQELVCLVTFFEREDVAAGRDVDVQRARVLPRHEAERRDGPNDRQRIFDYGTNQQTRETCRYLDRLN